jgi:hypothetical protein
MGKDKIAEFYADPVKQAVDAFAHDKAFSLRAISTEPGIVWNARRRGRFFGHLAMGTLRRLREGSAMRLPKRAAPTPAAEGQAWNQP